MILAIEPIFSDSTHATVNASLLEALVLACGDRAVSLAAHPGHYRAILETAPSLADRLAVREIDVEPTGGVTWARFRRHYDVLARQVGDIRPSCVILLAITAETLFACARIQARRPSVPIIAVLYGDLSSAVGWRSRDPRRRWSDHYSAIRAARRAGIRFVVLEEHIRQTAVALGLLDLGECDVWPYPIPDGEFVEQPPPLRADRLDLGFIGFAKREKGFDDFLYVADRAAAGRMDWCRFHLVGSVAEPVYRDRLQNIQVAPDVAQRSRFVAAVQALDYICMLLRDETYLLTSSGTMSDVYAALRPIIGLDTPALRAMTRGRGIGYLCQSREELAALVANRDVLFDRTHYRQFQEGLDALRRNRRPAELAALVAATIESVHRN